MRQMMGRRAALLGAGAGGTAWWLLGGNTAEATLSGTGSDRAICVKPPAETADPYPADGSNARVGNTLNLLAEAGVERRDLRPSFGDMTGEADGAPLAVEITLVNVGDACTPLADLALYLWHCDASGKYSLYDLPEVNHLRGLQRSDGNGVVRFTTIMPGCYDGRAPHMHFEVFTNASAAASGTNALLTAQFAFPESVMATFYAGDARYATSGGNLGRSPISQDNVFGDNTPEQLAAQTMHITGDAGSGYLAKVTVGLRLPA